MLKKDADVDDAESFVPFISGHFNRRRIEEYNTSRFLGLSEILFCFWICVFASQQVQQNSIQEDSLSHGGLSYCYRYRYRYGRSAFKSDVTQDFRVQTSLLMTEPEYVFTITSSFSEEPTAVKKN